LEDQPTYQTEFRDIKCRRCDYEGQPVTNGNTNFTHGHALYCPQCKVFYGWGGRKKELKDENGIRKISSQWPPKRLGVDFCQICLRTEDQLGDGETLESHHIIPVKNGGEDSPKNIHVTCTSCHKNIHHRRTYMNYHMAKFFEAHKRAADAES
jgi:5-methylcytosine-specific restriction endonuclease McrA